MASSALGITANQRALVDDTIFITGAPRSGTTLLGKILGTLQGLEYQFEPTTFYLVLSLYAMGRISKEAADALLHVHLYEDLLLEAVHGRRANLRPTDDSLLLNAVSWQELHDRWRTVSNRADAVSRIRERGHRLAIKMPNIMDTLPLLWETFPRSQVVLIARDGRDVVRSVVKRGWVRRESLAEELWPYRDAGDAVRTPYWVEDAVAPAWAGMSEATRACYMWRRHADFAREFLRAHEKARERFHLVRYEDLIARPRDTTEALSRFLGRPFTRFTESRLLDVRVPDSAATREGDPFLDGVEPAERARFLETNRAWGYGS
jgi:hypothetical protein